MSEYDETLHSRLFAPGLGRGTAVLNFGYDAQDAFDSYGRAFHEAGRALVDRIVAANGYSDLDALPILFMYRHSLELYLKAIVLVGREIEQIQGVVIPPRANPLRQHGLSLWMPEVKQVFAAVGWTWNLDEGVQTFHEAEILVRELESVDEKSDTFRYPVNRNGDDSLPSNFRVHLPTFCARLDALLEALDGATMGLSVILGQLQEMAYEMQSEHSDW